MSMTFPTSQVSDVQTRSSLISNQAYTQATHIAPPKYLSPVLQAGQELGLGITKDVEIKLRADNPPAAAKAAEPVSDKMLTAFAEKVQPPPPLPPGNILYF